MRYEEEQQLLEIVHSVAVHCLRVLLSQAALLKFAMRLKTAHRSKV